jgi:hypothetical protein
MARSAVKAEYRKNCFLERVAAAARDRLKCTAIFCRFPLGGGLIYGLLFRPWWKNLKKRGTHLKRR